MNNNKSVFELYSKMYWKLGLPVTCISNIPSENNFASFNTLKCPNHPWQDLNTKRQSLSDVLELDWNLATGIGTVTGVSFKNDEGQKNHPKLILIDIDGCTDIVFVQKFIKCLGLQDSYEWVVKSGSNNGFHIYILTFIPGVIQKKFQVGCAYKPKKDFEGIFLKIEIIWGGHAVLPPSLHMSTNYYEFPFCRIPQSPPAPVDVTDFFHPFEIYCNSNILALSSDWFIYGFPNGNEVIDIQMNLSGNEAPGEYLVYAIASNITNDGMHVNGKFSEIIQMTWAVLSKELEIQERKTVSILNPGYNSNNSISSYNLDVSLINKIGKSPFEAFRELAVDLKKVKKAINWNIEETSELIRYNFQKLSLPDNFSDLELVNIMELGNKHLSYRKSQSLSELYSHLYYGEHAKEENIEICLTLTIKCLKKILRG